MDDNIWEGGENGWNGWKSKDIGWKSINVDQIDEYGGQGIKMDEMDRTYLNRWQLTNVDRIDENV